jgi:hypothetical protein
MLAVAMMMSISASRSRCVGRGIGQLLALAFVVPARHGQEPTEYLCFAGQSLLAPAHQRTADLNAALASDGHVDPTSPVLSDLVNSLRILSGSIDA